MREGFLKQKALPRKFVFHRHFCHHFHSPFLQRDARVKEEVKVEKFTVTATCT
jgi:hypothetical protein